MLLKAKLWKHIEDVLELRHEIDQKRQKGEWKDDEEDGNVMNIYFGMSDYEHFKYYWVEAKCEKDKQMLRIKRKAVSRSANPNQKWINNYDKKINQIEAKDAKNTDEFTKFW